MKVLLLQLLLDGVAEVVLEIRQILAQDVHLLVIDVGALTLAGVFVGHWLVINFDAKIVLSHIVSLIEQDVTDELCEVDGLCIALDVVNWQFAKFDVHSYSCFLSADSSAGVVCCSFILFMRSTSSCFSSSLMGIPSSALQSVSRGQPVTSRQVYAVVCRYPDMFVKAEGRIMLMI